MEMANERKRDGGIVAPEWWRAEATNKRKDQGIRNAHGEDVSALAFAGRGAVDLDQSTAN